VWLAKHGARNLVLTSKRGMRTGTHSALVKGLRENGIKVSSHAFLARLSVPNARFPAACCSPEFETFTLVISSGYATALDICHFQPCK
jgi:hypothetical protein